MSIAEEPYQLAMNALAWVLHCETKEVERYDTLDNVVFLVVVMRESSQIQTRRTVSSLRSFT